MTQAAVLGGVFIGVLSALPVIQWGNCCCCLWIAAGGLLATYLDQDLSRPRTLARGAVNGFLAGVIGAFVWLIVAVAIQSAIAPFQEQILERLLDGTVDLPPELRDMLERNRGVDVGVAGHVVGFFLHLCAGVVFATLGGLLGALFFWRDAVPPALGGPTPPPPLPPQP